MARAKLFYFGFLCAAIVLFGCASWLPSGADDVGSTRGLIRFLVMFAAIGGAIATWGTAVMIASVHRVLWPLATTTVLILVSLALAAARVRHGPHAGPMGVAALSGWKHGRRPPEIEGR
jgi:hypothetical protein